MSGRRLKELEIAAADKVELYEDEISEEDLPQEEIEARYCALSDWYRVLGVCRFLAHADAEGLHDGLRQAGEARVELLRYRSTQRYSFNGYTASSRYLPLCCAVAAGADDVAEEIVHRSSTTLVKGEEDEADFAYAMVLHWLTFQKKTPRPDAALATLGELLGESSPRCAVATALVDADDKSFRPAFDALLEEWVTLMDEVTPLERGEMYRADAGLFVEGLAIARLAVRLGLRPKKEYRFVPSLARVP